MSDLAQAFLERWTQENVTSATLDGDKGEAERLAEACKAEALAEGFTEEELDEACAQSSDDEQTDIVSFMEAAVEKAAEAEDEEEIDEDDYGDGDEQ